MQNKLFTSKSAEQKTRELKNTSNGCYYVYNNGEWSVRKRLHTYSATYVLKGENWEKRS